MATSETKETRTCDQVMFLRRGKEPAVFDMQSDYKRTLSYRFLLISFFFLEQSIFIFLLSKNLVKYIGKELSVFIDLN